MGLAGTGFAGGFSQGLQNMLPLYVANQRRNEELALRKQAVALDEKAASLRERLTLAQLDKMLLEQQGMDKLAELFEQLGQGTEISGEPTPGAGTVAAPRVAPERAGLAAALTRAGMGKEALGLTPELAGGLSQQDILNVLGGGGAAPGAPGGAPAAGVSTIRVPTVNIGRQGVTGSIRTEPVQLKSETITGMHPTDPTRAGLYRQVSNPMTGQVQSTEFIGDAPLSSEQAKLHQQAIGYGVEYGSALFPQVVAALAQAETLTGKDKTEYLSQLQKNIRARSTDEKRRAAGPVAPSIEETTEAAEARERKAEGAKALTPTEAAQLGVPMGTTRAGAAGRQPTTSFRETQQASLAGSTAILDRMEGLLAAIKLPQSGTERMTASSRLLQESLAQSNLSLVLFESLKEGVLANLIRTFGERGTLNEGDIRRARALLPTVIPSFGGLPDTEGVARQKLQQLRVLIQEIDARTVPGAAPGSVRVPRFRYDPATDRRVPIP